MEEEIDYYELIGRLVENPETLRTVLNSGVDPIKLYNEIEKSRNPQGAIFDEEEYDWNYACNDLLEKLQAEIESENLDELEEDFEPAEINISEELNERMKEIEKKRKAEISAEQKKRDDALKQWLEGTDTKTEGTADGYSVEQKKDIVQMQEPKTIEEELEYLKGKKQDLLAEQRTITETEKIVKEIEDGNQKPSR